MLFEDVGGWVFGWALMTITLLVWLGWRSKTATVKRARRITLAAAAALAAASISLAATGMSTTMFPTALVTIAILVIEGLASMVGATAKPDVSDDAPTARAIERDR